ncbi:unnamed protein product [Brassica rapa]|uniref:Uncharacterized protein n=2 Tax=Brassica TaxID=3705 RepID=A0A8D9I3L4_BRACM|nr:unnamed protein product [Brassica napus]CAG7910948.1 unnamed protein product [Brassica rapa]
MFFFIQFESLSLYPITTNEMANALRYSYLRGPGGRLQHKLLGFLVERCSGALTLKNGNGHVAIDVNPIHNSQSGHVHSSKYSHSLSSKPKSDSVPLSLFMSALRSFSSSVGFLVVTEDS